MIPLSIKFQQKGEDVVWPEINGKEVYVVDEAPQIAVLDQGMSSGAPSVTIRLDLPDGKAAIAQTSAKLFLTAANMINAKYPGLLD